MQQMAAEAQKGPSASMPLLYTQLPHGRMSIGLSTLLELLHDMHGSSGQAEVNAGGGLQPISITVFNLYQ